MFELGTHKSKLYRSTKNEWFGGTEGFYWGCNNTKDLDVRLETIDDVEVRPAGVGGVSSLRPRPQMAGIVRQVQGQDRRRFRQAGLHDAADRRVPLGGRQVHDDGHGQGTEDVGAVRAAAGPDLAADAARSRRSSPRSGRWSATRGRCCTPAPPAAAKPAGPVAVDLHDPEHGDDKEASKEEHKRPETDGRLARHAVAENRRRRLAGDRLPRLRADRRPGERLPQTRRQADAGGTATIWRSCCTQKRADYNLGARRTRRRR